MEVDPEEIFQTACDVIRAALKGAQLTAADILSMGITTQRSTFTSCSSSTQTTSASFSSRFVFVGYRGALC
jgi:glycerol kinase